MKALETTWRGYRFRSRTEARWAVALTAAGVKFEYEAQGFDLPTGRYLPDFWLPERQVWLEIKGQEPTPREIALARDLSKGSGHRVLIAVGAPNPDAPYVTVIFGEDPEMEEMLDLPAGAYQRARAERFDGRDESPRTSSLKSRRWW